MLDAEAILKAYPDVNQVTDTQAFKHDENGELIDVTSELNQSLIDAARVELDKLSYQYDRRVGTATTAGYIDVKDQLDQLYHDMTDGKLGVAATTGSWYVGITSVKNSFPKS